MRKIEKMHRNTKNEPCVTVVTVTFNLIKNRRVNNIKQCIESVHNQSYTNVEHIIIDGASNDGSLVLLKEYVDLGWITLYSEPDNGIYDAMNKGIAKANGKYVNFLNSDDFLHDKRAIEINVANLEENDADYTYGDALVLKTWGRKKIWKGDLSKLLIGTHYCHQTMYVKTNVLRSLGGFDVSYCVSSDSDIMIRLYAQKYKSIYVPFCFLSFRKGGFSTQHENQMRIDHSSSFFKHIGYNINLSDKECFQLWHMQFFVEEPIRKQLELIDKVPDEFGKKNLLSEFNVRSPCGEGVCHNKRIYFLGLLPVVDIKNNSNDRRYLLFNLFDILKVVDHNGKRKYYLFGCMLVLKVKRYR